MATVVSRGRAPKSATGRRFETVTGGWRLLSANLVAAAGAGSVAGSAYIHLHLWQVGYSNIHIIGALFILQAIFGFALSAGIALTRRVVILSLGALFLLGTIGGLLASAWFGLFGFHDGFDAPYAGLSLSVEGGGAAVLVCGAVLRHRLRRST